MAKLLKLRRGTTSQHSSFTGAEGEVTVDTTKDTIVVHDGSTAGGTPLAKESAVTAIPAVIDEDDLISNSAIRPASQQSVRAYVNAHSLDEDNFASNSAVRPPSQQSVKAYVDALPDVIDEDNMATNSATRPPSQQSVKAYADTKSPAVLDEDNLGSDSATRPPSQQSVKAYVDAQTLTLIDEDNLGSNSAARPPSQQSVKAYVDAADATKAPLASPALTGTATGQNLTLSGNLTVNGTTTTIDTTNLDVEDKNITIGKVSTPSDTTADGGGITLKGASDKTFNWVNATDAWTSSEHINVGDSKKLLLGTGSDLEVYHTGAAAFITNNTGTFMFKGSGSSNIQFEALSGEDSMKLIPNGAVELYENGTKRAETTNSGFLVNGTVSDSKGDIRKIPQNYRSSAYTLVNSDGGKHILAEGNIVWVDSRHSAGDAITIVNNTAGDITITKGTTMYNTADGTNANRTLATRGMATILWVSGTVAYISGAGLS